MRKVLIIGGNGFLGSQLARVFASDSAVSVTIRSSSDTTRLAHLRESLSFFDLHQTSLTEIIKQQCFDIIVNAAVSYGRGELPASSVVQCNLSLPVEALEAGSRYGCACFINSDSFFSRIPDPYPYLPEYRLAKKQLQSWLAFFSNRIPIANVQIEHMYGEYDSTDKFLPGMVQKIVANTSSIDLTSGLQERDFVHVSDVALAFKCIADRTTPTTGISTFQVGTGESHSIKDTLLLVKKLAGSSTDLRFGALPYRESECMYSAACIDELIQVGWSPQVFWDRGMENLVTFYKEQRADA